MVWLMNLTKIAFMAGADPTRRLYSQSLVSYLEMPLNRLAEVENRFLALKVSADCLMHCDGTQNAEISRWSLEGLTGRIQDWP